MSLIDPTRIKALVEAQLATVNSTSVPVVLFPGMGVPDNTDRWARLVSIDLDSHGEDREDSTGATGLDTAGVVVTVQCFASQDTMHNTSGALAVVLGAVRKVLHQQTLRDVATTHQVDLTKCRTVMDIDPDDQRRTASGAVIVSGMAFRTSGTTMLSSV